MNTKRFLFGLFIGLFSLLLAYGFSGPVTTAVRQFFWNRTNCLMEHAEIDSRISNGMSVRYSYDVAGKAYKGTTWALPSNIQTSQQTLTSEVNRLEPGTTVACWYSPSSVERVVLVKESIWVVLFLLIPCAGFFGAYLLMRASIGRGRYKVNSSAHTRNSPNGKSKGEFFAHFGIYLFFGIFIAVGLILSYVFCLRHLYAVYEARQWSETTCTIKSSHVQTHTSTDSKTHRTSTSYSIEVTYHFMVGDKKFAGDTYSVGDSAQSNSEYAYNAISKIPVGSVVTCFYDPDDPTRSTISRDLENVVWLGLTPLIFTCAGLLGLFYTLQSGPSNKERNADPRGRVRKAQSRVLGLINLIFANIVWNGIVAIGTYAFVSAGEGSWFVGVIILPFALIGILLIVALPYAFLQLFNPSVDIQTVDDAIRYGQQFTVGWKLNGSSRRVSKLRVTMELLGLQPAREVTTSPNQNSNGSDDKVPSRSRTRSTSNRNGKTQESERVIYTHEIFTTEHQNRIEKGSTTVKVPEKGELDIPAGSRNLRWKITIYLVIRWYPDAQDSVILNVQE